MDDVDNTLGQCNIIKNISHFLHKEGRLGRWFIYKGVAHTNGARNKPAKNKCRKVKGCNAAEYTQWLLNDPAVNPSGNIIQGLTLDQCGDTAGRFNNLNDTLYFTPCLADMFGLVNGNGDRQFFQIVDHGLTHVKDICHTLADIRPAPSIIGGIGAVNRRQRGFFG